MISKKDLKTTKSPTIITLNVDLNGTSNACYNSIELPKKNLTSLPAGDVLKVRVSKTKL